MEREMLNYIVCPECKRELDTEGTISQSEKDIIRGVLKCKSCKRKYEIEDAVPILKIQRDENGTFEKHANEFDAEWKKFRFVETQRELDSKKVNPELTENSTRMEIASMYESLRISNSRILDIGCGLGFDIKRIKEMTEKSLLFGIDVSEIAVKQAKRNKTPAYLCVAFAEALPYPDNFFDLIISHEVLEHVVAPGECLGEMARVIKSNGKIALSTPNGRGLFSAFIEPAKLQLKKILGRKIIKRYKDSPLGVSEIEKICDHLRLRIGKVGYTCPFYFLGNSITEHMPGLISKMITKLIVRYSDRLAKLPLVNALICDEMTIIIEKTNN